MTHYFLIGLLALLDSGPAGSLDHSVITTFIFSVIALLVVAFSYFANKWVENIVTTTSKLTASVEKMTTLISNVEKEQVFLRTRLAQNTRDILSLQTSKRCTNEQCPFTTMHVHMRDGDTELMRSVIEDGQQSRLPFEEQP